MNAGYQNKGLLIVVSGPSGVGKGTVCDALRRKMPQLTYSVSTTTRSPREGETEGINYYFKSIEQFKQMIADGALIEWAQYVENYYGTPYHFVKETIESGKDILLEIEVQGALQVKQRFPEGVFVFLIPPTLDDLRSRILNRGSETRSSLSHRLNMATDEFNQINQYDYVVINDEVELACERVQSIITAEHCRRDRLVIN